MLRIAPCGLREAGKFVNGLHRHLPASRGCRFCLAAIEGNVVVGVAMCGRPVARALGDRFNLEVTRCCTDGTWNACSLLYGACARVARELGYNRISTYILASESGVSLRASGWQAVALTQPHSWQCPSHPKQSKSYPETGKVRYEKILNNKAPITGDLVFPFEKHEGRAQPSLFDLCDEPVASQ